MLGRINDFHLVMKQLMINYQTNHLKFYITYFANKKIYIFNTYLILK